jgi:hypothetical protein
LVALSAVSENVASRRGWLLFISVTSWLGVGIVLYFMGRCNAVAASRASPAFASSCTAQRRTAFCARKPAACIAWRTPLHGYLVGVVV